MRFLIISPSAVVVLLLLLDLSRIVVALTCYWSEVLVDVDIGKRGGTNKVVKIECGPNDKACFFIAGAKDKKYEHRNQGCGPLDAGERMCKGKGKEECISCTTDLCNYVEDMQGPLDGNDDKDGKNDDIDGNNDDEDAKEVKEASNADMNFSAAWLIILIHIIVVFLIY